MLRRILRFRTLLVLVTVVAARAGSITSIANFTTSGQSIWKAGAGGSIGGTIFNGTTWGTDFFIPIPIPFVYTQFSGYTSGYVGIQTGYLATAGHVDATVPYNITLDYSLAANAKSLMLSSSFAPLGKPQYTAFSPQLQVYNDVVFRATFDGDSYVSPVLGTPDRQYFNLDTGDLRIPLASINRDGDQSLKVFGQTVGVDVSGPIQVRLRTGFYEVGSISANTFPFIQTSEIVPHNNADLMSLNADLVAVVQAGALSAGFPTPPLSVDFGSFGMSIFSAEAGVVLGLDETTDVYGGRPTLGVTLLETGQQYQFLAGDSLSIDLPSNVKHPHFTTSYTLNGANTARFKNQLAFTLNPRLTLELGRVSAGAFHTSLYSYSTPNFTPPINLPLIDFGLQGFNTIAGASFDFNQVTDSPEPGTLVLMGLGLILLACVRRRALSSGAAKG